ncbi:hypothetical protein CspeluHIS016_0404870 [Cutaneotrichosporon spelunceum]|uniref:Uncharacterized protein n=1 Tax=Cutaneotrichosporon spelunceum TaxID=1672016 RepID=A0AAD3YCZ3_9TREE|nr:hypothetical protein CspeluHIS016_0404870 [Cutaneotrichosporon spelunceum]
MTDHGRRSLSSKIRAKLKPESRKTFAEAQGDRLADRADGVASRMQPQHHKSVGQKITDAFSRNSSNRRAI